MLTRSASVFYTVYIALACSLLLALMSASVSAADQLDVEQEQKNMPIKQSNGKKAFYRGDFDDQTTTMENGAVLHRDYAAFITEGPWAEVKTWPIGERIHTITGYGLSNYTFIEGDTGLILFDTGLNVGTGHELLKMKQSFSDKPVIAIIYSHHHYTAGSKAFADALPERKIAVYGHPDVDAKLLSTFSVMAPAALSRGARQFGNHLPKTGPDAEYGIEEPHFDEPELNQRGHLPVTHPVADGEEITIDGVKFVFHHAIADTEDSLIVHLPELDAVLHNSGVMAFLFPMYTLRGDFYRSPPDVINSIDKLRALRPEHLIGCHGFPVSGREKAYAQATMHRDALAFLYQQTIRGMNEGLAPDELVARIEMPRHFDNVPELFPAYVDSEYIIRGIYSGLIGWWANDTSELHPPEPAEFAGAIVEGFGGADKLLARAQQAADAKQYNLAAKLLSLILNIEADHTDARQLKASVLRRMAYATRTGIQTRNFLLTEALELEGKIDTSRAPEGGFAMGPAMVLAFPPGTFLRTLAYQLDPSKAGDLSTTVKITLTDIDRDFTLAIRRGVAEFVEAAPEQFDLSIAFERTEWAQIAMRQKALKDSVREGKTEFTGAEHLQQSLLNVYDGIL